ncbi:class I SAM-dependent methyltransferase [Halomonas faecis]|uniref:class I SAM-dependent methyltransferase n=1 Tax=Halomonas faecis TaxID=1562110 RepID=UPI0013D86B1A|nr:class I SAM-dependent methyltransferase [Halomonas faecis]
MNILEHNRNAWNRESAEAGEWSRPVDSSIIQNAKDGRWTVILTPNKPVPSRWLGELRDKRILCLASGGGQQAPILAAAGAEVVSFDLSEEQLEKDRLVSDRDRLGIQCIRGDMANLSVFSDAEFDLIFHPVANVFVPDVVPVWRECYRVLKSGGSLLAGFMNPLFFLFDHESKSDPLKVKFKLPYREPESFSEAGRVAVEEGGRALEFGHTLESQIGGQLSIGFILRDLYEDYWSDEATPLNGYSPTYIATWAEKRGF